MKERKPLFPEYIWMFFVGLLLAIIVCMRLLPGHAETVNPVYGNPNVFTWESLQNPSSVFQAPFNTSGWINSEGNIYLDASVYRSNDSGASFYGPMIDYEYVALQNPIIYGEIGATYSGTDLITVSSNNNNGTVPVSAIPSSLYYQFFEHGYSYFACDLWCFPWESWSNNPVNIGYVILKMSSGSVPTVYKRTGLANYSLFQVDLDSSNIVDMMYYFNNNIGYYDVDLDYVLADRWVNFGGSIGDSADDYFLFTDPELNEDYKLFISTVYMGIFNFQHTGDWNELYSKNFKYRITVDSRYFEVEATASPTPSPEPESHSELLVFYMRPHANNSSLGYYAIEITGNLGVHPIPQPTTDNSALAYAISQNNVGNDWVNTVFLYSDSDRQSFYLYTGGLFESVSMYYLGDIYSEDLDYIHEYFTPSWTYTTPTAGIDGYTYAFSWSSELNLSCLSVWHNTPSYATFELAYHSDFNGNNINIGENLATDYFITNPYTLLSTSVTNLLGLAYIYGNDSNFVPSPTPTPEGWVPTVTPTPTPVPETVVVILPSPTPGPTAPVSFSGSDLPGGGAGGIDGTSGNAGSISTNGGASPSTANGVYNYWSTVLSQNQALAFIASFFHILPFDLVYALGSLIFILILLAMARLFIHFIE